MQLRDHCHRLAGRIEDLLHQGERVICVFEGETTEFVRLQQALIRQSGEIRQLNLTLDLSVGQRHAKASTKLRGEEADDLARIKDMFDRLRRRIAVLQPDPYFLCEWHGVKSDVRSTPKLAAAPMLADIFEYSDGLDLVGTLASGPLYR